jgi:hypothetical protein
MSHLINEIGLRLLKALIALVLGIVLYVGLSAAAFVLLVETGLF